MAQKVQILLTDDLDGSEADETLKFTFGGKEYEIDLNTKNADKFRKVMDPYVTAGRRTGSARGKGSAAKSSSGSDDTAAIRTWAKENGYEVNDRGRVPSSIREAYAKANG